LFSANYLPHRYCYLAQPGLVWTSVSMDALIAASYGLIFASLFWIAFRLRRNHALESYLWIFLSFGIFILACGATHMMEVVTVWWPVYPLSAAVKVVCAAASIPTAILFAKASAAIAANILRFLQMLSTTQQEKDQALTALVASEKLAAAGRVATSIAHEIRNPLNTLGDLLYVLSTDPRLPADLLGVLESANAQVTRANGTAQTTLSLFQGSTTPTPLSFATVVESVLELHTSQFLQRNIALQPRIRTPLSLKSYPGEVQQILINLIQNAAAAIGTGGVISLRIQPRHRLIPEPLPIPSGRPVSMRSVRRRGQPGYSITVADNGSGISRANRARLFTLFFSTKGEEGTGVGLWLVRSMVEKQGGRITFRSRTATESRKPGTIFNVWIPLEPAPLAGSPASTEPHLRSTERLKALQS
jgi:signal transduction histidine kinase